MARPIRVLHFIPGFGLGGTERTAEIFCRHLDRTRFEPSVAGLTFSPPTGEYWKTKVMANLGIQRYQVRTVEWSGHNSRLKTFQAMLGSTHVLAAPDWSRLRSKILANPPDLLHVHYSGNEEPPINDTELITKIPNIITTNVFGNANKSPNHARVDRLLFVSNYLLNEASWINQDPRAGVLYNPIEAAEATTDLRAELGLSAEDFVVGRVGRPSDSIHHPIALQAYREIETAQTCFLALAPSRSMLEQSRALGLRRFIALPPSTDSLWLSRLYRTFNVLAHARRDGETFGCNIAEAMIHGKPVVSHRSELANAQEEIIGETGFVCEPDDVSGYAAHLRRFRDEPGFAVELGKKAQLRALQHFEAKAVTRQLEQIYTNVTLNLFK